MKANHWIHETWDIDDGVWPTRGVAVAGHFRFLPEPERPGACAGT